LAGNEVNPADEDGRTPLSRAAGLTIWPLDTEEGYRRVANILLGHNHTYLWKGDWKKHRGAGRERVAGMILERREVDPDSIDKSGRIPLSWAAGEV